MAALSRFISRLGKKGVPFYKLLKKVDKFQWTTEAHEALDALKKFLTTPPVLKPPRRATSNQPTEDLLLYISCTTHVVSTVLVVEWTEEGRAYLVQHPVYFISDTSIFNTLQPVIIWFNKLVSKPEGVFQSNQAAFARVSDGFFRHFPAVYH
jgi:hypothetical protein